MSTPSTSESFVVKFLDNFLQEKNIRWVLATGMLILLGSSLMMVMPRWDAFAPIWKFLTIVGYTATIWKTGWWSYHRFALRKTGTTLLALAMLMIPVSFMAWHWMWIGCVSTLDYLAAGALLLLNAVMAAVASRQTFRHFLQGDQPTFVASYLILSVAGAVAPFARTGVEAWSWLSALALWGVFSIGVTKVNRHVFWLTEEFQRPRIFGFFPILLLGGQFLAIFAANLAWSLSTAWMGLACVLIAIPVLFTADAVARVFQARTGNLVRPIPWPIVLPLTVGLVLCVAGIVVAGTAIPQRNPYALVPTATLVAYLMVVVARRTQGTAFVWAMLVAITLAYNFSPVFFQGFARAVVAQGTVAVRESRLPYAFYGLTYLPLIVAMTGIAAYVQRRGVALFTRPLSQYCVGISWILLATSVGHIKAVFPVATVMLIMFAGQAVLFRDRRLAMASIIALYIAAAGSMPFVAAMFDCAVPAPLYFLVPLCAAAALLAASPMLDPRIGRLPPLESDSRDPLPVLGTSMCRTLSWCGTMLVAMASISGVGGWLVNPSALASLAILSILVVHSLIWARPAISWFVYTFGAIELGRYAVEWRIPVPQIWFFVTAWLVGQWLLNYLATRHPQQRIWRAWGEVNRYSASAGLLLLTVFVAVPSMAGTTVFGVGQPLNLIRNVLLTLWCADAARQLAAGSPTSFIARWGMTQGNFARHYTLSAVTSLGFVCVLGVVSSLTIYEWGLAAQRWIAVAWAVTAVGILPLVEYLRRQANAIALELGPSDRSLTLRAIRLPLETIMYVLFSLFVVWHVIDFTTPVRIAACLASVGLLAASYVHRQPLRQQTAIAIANWTAILVIANWFSPQAAGLVELLTADAGLAQFCIAALASASLLLWNSSPRLLQELDSPLAEVQRRILQLATFGSLLLTLKVGRLEPLAACLSGGAFAALIASELRAACRSQQAARVWHAEFLGALTCAYFLWFRVIRLGHGWSMFATLGVGVVLYVFGMLAKRRTSTAILSGPFCTTGLWLPLVTVAVGIYRHLAYGDRILWHGMNSLAILLAGAFYFWQAVERRSKRFAILSAAILNVALALLWRELELNDPQFYMIPVGISVLAIVQVLKREIPLVWHDPLRYAGALTILVSPTFHIVSGSWLHLFTLMIASTAILLMAIGLRIRPLMYAGAAFLVADLIGMVVCGGIDHPSVLWLAGIGFGGAIISLGAFCEHNREKLLQRMRMLSAQLKQWE